MPSPMALHPQSLTPSMFEKKNKKTSPKMTSAASYLAAVSQAHGLPRSRNSTPSSTPALSISSSTVQSVYDVELDMEQTSRSALLRSSASTTEHGVSSAEFGYCANESYRYTSQHRSDSPAEIYVEQDPPYYILLSTYIGYLILICFGHLRDFFGRRFSRSAYTHLMPIDGYAALNSDFDSFYTRRFKLRLDQCFSRPVTGVPGRTINLLDRTSSDYNRTFTLTGTRTRALNVSSYNYLGFAQACGGCAEAVAEAIRRCGVTTCGSRLEGGTSDLHLLTEELIARFVGMEDALLTSMGFATNSTIIPALVGKGCLVISDEFNHASIRTGVRLSGASVRMFKHNDMASLEALLREVISQGQPRTHRSWKKILIIVEGLYSMEGTLVNLPAIIELKRKYKFFLFIDEAHSIGALGPHGRGVADYFNIPPPAIDILMGTLTKSFGAVGGYISGSKALIDRLRVRSHSGPYAESIPPPVLAQIMASMASIMGVSSSLPTLSSSSTVTASSSTLASYMHPGPAPASALPPWMSLPPALRDGSEGYTRLRRLAFNSRYLARGLKKLGFITYGHVDSPIVPLLLFNTGKMPAFSMMMLEHSRNRPAIAVVVVAYPATALVTSRVRFCVSASHTKEDMDLILRACDEIGDVLDLKHGSKERWSVDEIIERAVELVEMK